MDKKEKIKKQIEVVLNDKAKVHQNIYSKSLEQLVEDLKIYQYELEFQNDELMRIQTDLENSRNEYLQLFQHAPIGYVVLDNDMRIVESNQAFLKIILQAEIFEIQIDFRKFIHPDNQDVFHFFKNELMKHRLSKQIEIQLITTHGQYRDVSISGNFYMKNIHDGYLRLAISDISERKQTEDQLMQTKGLLHQISKLAKVGGWELDLTTNTLHWTDVTCEIHEVPLDYQPDQGAAISFYQKDEDGIKICRLIDEAIETGKPFEEELQILTAKGNLRWVKVNGHAVFSDGKCRRVFGTFQDIEEKRKADESLKINEMRLTELNATKDKFFSIIAHDLKSPFNAIIGFSNILTEQMREKDYDGIEEYAGYIQDSSNRAMSLLVNLLEWARSQTGRIDYNPEYIEIVGLINELTELFVDLAQQKSIAIFKELPHHATVFADRDMLKTILRNLISNAIKFTQPGGNLNISAELEDNGMRVSVSDNGVGISKSLINKLFKIEETSTTNGTQNETGTGLGLILCKEFVERHGGKIWVESTPGIGSKFSFVVPKVGQKVD